MPIPGNNLMDNLFMAPATDVTYEQWWWEFIAEHDDWRFADSDALRKAAFKGGQEPLRQQLAAAQEALENEQAKSIHSCHANCTMDRCVNRKLRQQLETARIALQKLSCLGNGDHPGNSTGNRIAQHALLEIWAGQ